MLQRNYSLKYQASIFQQNILELETAYLNGHKKARAERPTWFYHRGLAKTCYSANHNNLENGADAGEDCRKSDQIRLVRYSEIPDELTIRKFKAKPIEYRYDGLYKVSAY